MLRSSFLKGARCFVVWLVPGLGQGKYKKSLEHLAFVLSHSVVSDSFTTHGVVPPGSPVHGISRQEYCSGLSFPSPGDLPNTEIKPMPPTLTGRFFTTESTGKSNISFSVQFSHSVMSDSLRPQESQHARPPCPSPTPGVHSNSCPSSP